MNYKSQNEDHPFAHSALLVIDMQEHFRSIGTQLVPELNATIQAFRAKQLPVIFTQHGHRKVELDSGQLGKFWGHLNMIEYGSQQWELMSELDVIEESDYKIIEKRRYDAFHGTILEEILHQLKVDSIVISGVMTNLCCETTARSAFCRDFAVYFLADGTATCNKEMHEEHFKILPMDLAESLNVLNFVRNWKNSIGTKNFNFKFQIKFLFKNNFFVNKIN